MNPLPRKTLVPVAPGNPSMANALSTCLILRRRKALRGPQIDLAWSLPARFRRSRGGGGGGCGRCGGWGVNGADPPASDWNAFCRGGWSLRRARLRG